MAFQLRKKQRKIESNQQRETTIYKLLVIHFFGLALTIVTNVHEVLIFLCAFAIKYQR